MFIKKFFTVFITDLYIFSVCSHSQDSRVIEIPRSSNYFLHFFHNSLFHFETIFTEKQKKQILTSHFEGCKIFQILIRPLRLFLRKRKNTLAELAHESKSNLIILSFQEKKRKMASRLAIRVQQSIDTLISSVGLKSAAHWKRSRLLWLSIFFLIIRSNTPRTSFRCDRYRES